MLIFPVVLIVLQLAVWWFYPSTPNTFTGTVRPMRPSGTRLYVNKTYVSEHLDTVLLGGMSFIGSRLAVYLNGKVRNIRVMEDVINVDPDPMKWYRWGELNKLGIAQSIYDSNIITNNLPCKSLVIYIPTMYNGKINKDGNQMWKPLHYYIQLKNMLIVLLNNKCSRDWIIVLTYQYNDFNLQMAWINLLERLLMNIVLNLNEDITISLIKIGQVYGPWQDNLDTIPVNSLYIDELGTIVKQVLTKPESEIFDYMTRPYANKTIGNTGVVETRKWLVEYKKLCEMPKKDIVTAAALKIRGSYNTFDYNDHVNYIDSSYDELFIRKWRLKRIINVSR